MVLHIPSKLCIALCIIQLAKCEQQPGILGRVAGAVKSGYSYGAQAAAKLWNWGWGKKPPPPAPEPVKDDQHDQPENRLGVDIGPVTDDNPEPKPAREGEPPYGQANVPPEGQAPYGQDKPYQPNNPPESQRPAVHDYMQSSPVDYQEPQGPPQGQPQGYQQDSLDDDDIDDDLDYFDSLGKEGQGDSEGDGYQGNQRYEPEYHTPEYYQSPPPPPPEFYPQQPQQQPSPTLQTQDHPFRPISMWNFIDNYDNSQQSGPEQFYQAPPPPPIPGRLGFTPYVPGWRLNPDESSYQNQPPSSYFPGSGQRWPEIPYSGDEGYERTSGPSEYQSLSPSFRYNMERAISYQNHLNALKDEQEGLEG